MNWANVFFLAGMLTSAWMLWGEWAALFTLFVTVQIVYHFGKH